MNKPLEDIIKAQIETSGPMDVGAFMNIALGHPEHGYYMNSDPFGRGGDFTTAPEISQMFGELVGAWVADLWMQMGRPARFMWLECGPGRGTLMADALRATRKLPGFHQAAQIVLMEMSPFLKDKQKETLADFTTNYKIEWVDNLNHPLIQSSDYPIICVANEFLDALPVRQFVKQGMLWHERVVGLVDGALAFGMSPPVEPPSDGTVDGIYEVGPARNAFVRELCLQIRTNGGAALLIDYGYERSAPGDTLQALRAHQFVPVLEDAGQADITAHVDFQAIAHAAAGCAVHGPVTQGDFLRHLGIGVRAEMLKKQGDAEAAEAIDAAVRRLTDAEQMGTLFKVMALCAEENLKPAGF
ncbi:MAG: SAM-dependent methyltransferase [Alphaproteobacteria bacterium]|nr:SAM-dependent methyltransferase [Alphaproteobacteria bacterium]